MLNYYATFMQKQAFKNRYVQIVAPDVDTARQCMFDHFGGKFMTVYDSEGFAGQDTKYGLSRLCIIHCEVWEHSDQPTYTILEANNAIF